MHPVKIKIRLFIALLIVLPALLFSQQLLNEMEIIDSSDEEDVKSTIIRNPNTSLLIVKSQISNLLFKSNNRILESQQTSPGIWHIQLVPGTHRITFQAAGFISNQIRLFFNRNEVKGLRIRVVPTGETSEIVNSGLLVITSEPESAQVYIDNEPFAVTNYVGRFPIGTYQIRVEKQYFEAYEREINVSDGVITPVNINLTPLYGSIEVHSYPESARLILNGEEIGDTPFKSNRIQYGQHLLEINLPDYESVERIFLLNDSNKVENFSVRLTRRIAALTLALQPRQAHVFIDEKEITSLPVQNYPLTYGQHSVNIYRPGYSSYGHTFVVNTSDPIRLEINLEQKSKFIATLLSFLVPGTGQIYSGNSTRGVIIGASFIGGIAGTYLLNNLYSDERKKFLQSQQLYENNIDVNNMGSLYKKMMSTYENLDNLQNLTRILAGASAAIWLYGIFDAIFFFPELEYSGIRLSSSNDSIGITAYVYF